MTTLLELNKILLRRGGFSLRIDRLQLQPGKLYALQGENGAGKSTLLQLLALLQTPESGEFRFEQQPVGRRGRSLRSLRQQVTLLEQNPLLFAGSVEQNLAFGLKLRGIRGAEAQRRIDAGLEATGLQGFKPRTARELSGGESRRVALARALVLQPKLLLLDEPTANLDTGQVAALERFLVRLPATGMTLVIATHDAEQPHRLGGEILRLQNGRLEQLAGRFRQGDVIPLLRQVKG